MFIAFLFNCFIFELHFSIGTDVISDFYKVKRGCNTYRLLEIFVERLRVLFKLEFMDTKAYNKVCITVKLLVNGGFTTKPLRL
jgi:hypothetical protein